MDNYEFSQFARGLNEPALESAAQFLSEGIGRDLLARKDFQVFIRNNYIDFYWNGCRILSYKPLAAKNKYCVNSAYMLGLNAQEAKKNISLKYSGDDLTYNDVSFRERILDDTKQCLGPWVKGKGHDAEREKKGEKELLYQYWESNPQFCFLDVEIAFSVKSGVARPRADRLDFAYLEPESKKLVLVEAKVDTDSRLRSKAGIPPVVAKVKLYKQFLCDQEENLVHSYKRIIQNVLHLELASRFCPGLTQMDARHRLETLVTDLSVQLTPRLLVFRSKKEWSKNDMRHWTTLGKELEGAGFEKPVVVAPITEVS